MNILVTGAYGRVGTALLDYQSEDFEYIPFDKKDNKQIETIVGDVSDYESIKNATEDRDGVVHLAADSNVNAEWGSILQSNIIGAYNCIEACRQQQVKKVVLASSNHVVGMYEKKHAPKIYNEDYDLLLDSQTPIYPDSLYGTSKAFLEALGRYYVENYEYPKQVYVLRIGSVRFPEYDHPYGDAERGVENGLWERKSDRYRQEVRRMKATWQSRRDVVSLIECCLHDKSVNFDMFYGVSNNSRRWFDIEHAQSVVGYNPQDSGDDWQHPPEDGQETDSV